ncbi:MAG: hypothetical protein ACK2UU_21610 [Anaerolineae bacterium]
MKGKLPRVSLSSKGSRTPSTQALIVIFISLFILFLWLNFVLTQQVEMIGRDIQVKSEELQSLQRQGDAYRQAISVNGSQWNMSEKARLLGYQPQAPVFLRMSEPLAEPVSEAPAPAVQPSALASSEDMQVQTSSRLWLLLTGQLLGPEIETAP